MCTLIPWDFELQVELCAVPLTYVSSILALWYDGYFWLCLSSVHNDCSLLKASETSEEEEENQFGKDLSGTLI